MIDSGIAILKFVGILLTAVFGVAGLLVKYRDDQGRATNAGKAALSLIVASAVVAAGSQALEFVRQRQERESVAELRAKETLAAVERTEKTLVEINRGLHPLNDVRLSYWIRVPSDHPAMRPYLARFEREVVSLVPRLRQTSNWPGITYRSLDATGKIREFGFSSASSLAPRLDPEKLAYTILFYSEIDVELFRKPIDPTRHRRLIGAGNDVVKADLGMNVMATLHAKWRMQKHEVGYELETKTFRLQAHAIHSDPKYWQSTGEIVGIPDLLGAQMFIFLPSVMMSGDAGIDQYVREVRQGFELETLILNISGGREFWFRREKFERYVDRDGSPAYTYVFPSSLERMNALRDPGVPPQGPRDSKTSSTVRTLAP